MITTEVSQFYSYLDTKNPMVNWEVAIGRIRSSCDRTDTKGVTSFWHYSNLKKYLENNKIERIKDEYQLEAIRRQYYPDCVSRLTCVYFFETSEIANTAIDRWKIDPSKKEFITPINFSASNVTRVDSEWISNCLGRGNAKDDWMHNYWKGDTYGDNPLTEVLASGIGLVADSRRSRECFMKIYELSPSFAKLAMFGIAGLHSGVWGGAQVVPIVGWSDNKLKGNYYFDMREMKKNTKVNWDQCIKKVIDMGYRFGKLPVLDIGNDIVFPDFGMTFEFEFEPDEKFLALLNLI